MNKTTTWDYENCTGIKRGSGTQCDNPSTDDGLSNTRRVTYFNKNKNISSCIDYFKFRFIDFVDLPHSQQEYLDSAHHGFDPGTADFSFIGELCSILLLKPYEYYEQNGFQGYSLWAVFDEDVFLFGGRKSENTKDDAPTFFFEMKGHALRMFEMRCEEKEIDVFHQYKKLFEFCHKYSLPSNGRYLEVKRIDVTIDDYSNFISFALLF